MRNRQTQTAKPNLTEAIALLTYASKKVGKLYRDAWATGSESVTMGNISDISAAIQTLDELVDEGVTYSQMREYTFPDSCSYYCV